MSYKINEAIKVYYRAVGAESGITDLQFITTNPSGTDIETVIMSEVSNHPGLYSGSFTPNAYGRWWIRLKSTTYPENVLSESYLVEDTFLMTPDNKIITSTTDGSKERLDVNATIAPRAKIDTNNSTTSTLEADEVYTGTYTNIIDYSHISIQIKSDQASTTDGLVIEWSNDGVNLIDTDKFTLVANEGKVFTFGCQAPYYRIKYTNGGVAQTFFNLTVLIKSTYQKASSHRIIDNISNQDDAELVKAVLTGLSPSGDFLNVSVNRAGQLQVAPAPGITPSGKTEIYDLKQAESADTQRYYTTIPSGESITITRFRGSAEGDGHTSKISLYYAPNGNTTGIELITIPIHSEGSTSSLNILWTSPIGDGTKAIMIQLEPIDAGTREMNSQWEGYY